MGLTSVIASCALLGLMGCSNSPSRLDVALGGASLAVKGYCLMEARSQFSYSTRRRGRAVSLFVLLALEGKETVTRPLPEEHTGDQKSMRQLLEMNCRAFLADDESYADALSDEREKSECDVVLIDLAALAAGQPFSFQLKPRIEDGWKIRRISPSFNSIEVGDARQATLRITGGHLFPKEDFNYDMSAARVSWEYAVGTEGMSQSRVQLAADCPAF